jgi:hypothetical protein
MSWLKKFWNETVWPFIRKKLGLPDPVEPTDPAQPVCGCGTERVSYTGASEQISNSGPSGDLRGLINDHSGAGTWVTNKMLPYVHFVGTKMTVDCFDLETGKRAHFLGSRQPSTSSTMVTANPTTVSTSGTLRCYFESRKKA